MRHLIQQHYIHADIIGTDADGLALQQRLPDLCYHYLIPAIEHALNRFEPTSGHWIIEHLDIDAGVLSGNSTGLNWGEAVEQALEQALRKLPVGIEADATKLDRQTERESVLEAFLYFLQTGSLPWHFHLPTGKTLEQMLLATWETSSESPTIAEKHRILNTLAINTVRQRLVWQFSPEFLLILLTRLDPIFQESVENILKTVSVFPLLSATESKQLEQALWVTVFQHITLDYRPNTDQLMQDSLQQIKHLPTANALRHLTHDLLHALPLTDKHPSAITSPPFSAPIDTTILPVASTDIPASHVPASSIMPETALHNTPTVLVNTLYTHQAGLVLLHPFLPHFFERLGIADGEKILQPERATALLHFLTTGQTIAPEYELALPKILCNLPLNTPLVADVGLTETELAEAQALLEAVIHHWSALRNTSPDGLRGNFLERLGKLSPHPDGGWLLQVETQTHDILLDQLPWGIGMVKLPWMPRLLWVEWH